MTRISSWTLVAVALAACGDNNNTSMSATAGMSSTTVDPTGTPTTGSPTTGPATTGTSSGGDSDAGTASESATGTTATTGTTSTTTGSTSTTGTTGQVSASSGGESTSTTSTTGDTTTGGGCIPGETEGMGDVEKSFLWVANSDEGTVSKVDTQKVLEVGRYRTGPLGGGYAENPSRTAVSFDGRYVIVNGRQSGRSTVIAANVEDCVDKNGNGMIETSQNKADILAWGSDECVVWSVTHPFNGDIGGGPRGVTWHPGQLNQDTCKFEDPEVWVGYLPGQFGTAHMARLDGATGMVEETVVINNWSIGDTTWGPYGAALDKELNVWFIGLRGEVFRINTQDNPATFDRWTPPGTQLYGMTVDPDGDPWFGPNCGMITTFDPVNEQFISVPGTDACHRGLAADKDGSVWVADNSQCGVWQVDHKMNKLIAFHSLNPCSTPVGVSTDLEGFVWVVDEGGWAWKIDPNNVPAMQKVDITGDHYTYSDMTGGQIKSVILPQ